MALFGPELSETHLLHPFTLSSFMRMVVKSNSYHTASIGAASPIMHGSVMFNAEFQRWGIMSSIGPGHLFIPCANIENYICNGCQIISSAHE